MRALLIVGGVCCGLLAAHADTFSYSTLAGSAGNTGTSDGTNSTARFSSPYGVAVDGAGSIYIADTLNHAIRRVAPAGTNWVVQTLAGHLGTGGSADGTNSTALFNGPSGVAVDGAGNLYVADGGNYTVRKVTPVGTNWWVSTLAGSSGNPGSSDGTNSAALFTNPFGVAVDSAGTLYVSDRGYNTVRKVARSGTNWVVTTLAGSTAGDFGTADGTNRTARFNEPAGVAVDSATNLYVSDSANYTIRKLMPVGTNWVVTTVAGLAGTFGSADGTNSSARFKNCDGVAVDGATNLYVADTVNSTVRKVARAGTNWVTSTIGGLADNGGTADGTNSSARFRSPSGVAVDGAGQLYVADTGNSTVRLGVPWLTNAPLLRFARSTNQLVLSWPLTAHGFLLETRGTVSPGTAWGAASGSAVIAGSSYYWTNTPGPVPAYYRLHKQ